MANVTLKIEFTGDGAWLKERTKELGWQETVTITSEDGEISVIDNPSPWVDYISEYSKGVLVTELLKAQRQQTEAQIRQSAIEQLRQVESIVEQAINISVI